MLSKEEQKILIKKSYNNRLKVLKMLNNGAAHLGGMFSCLDILTVLYNKILKHDPNNPKWESRDRFILSSGHKGVAQYVTLQDCGYFEEEILWTYNKFKSRIPEHPDEKTIPGVEFPTGSLGHGVCAACGIAIAAKIDRKDYKVFVLLGDGECAEGIVWEAAMASAHYNLDNLVAIVDRNGLQVNGRTTEIMDTSPLEDKFIAFGWDVKVINGHNYNQIYESLRSLPFSRNKPSCIIANTIKCKGITFAEDDFSTHHCHWEKEKLEKAIEVVKYNKNKELLKVDQS